MEQIEKPQEQIYHSVHSGNPLRKIVDRFSSYSRNKTFGVLAVAILIATVPLTAFIAQKQTNTQQHAAEIVYSYHGISLSPPDIAKTAHGIPSIPGIKHGLGALVQNKITAKLNQRTVIKGGGGTATSTTPALPESVDLSQYAVPVGDQGSINSCVAWAQDYYQRGWYAKRDGYFPNGGSNGTGSYAPMYTYTQVPGGSTNSGTYPSDHYDIMVSQGVDTRADYSQGDFNYTDQPNASEKAQAGVFKIASYSLWDNDGTHGTYLQQAIENAMASGNPVILTFPVYDNYENANASNYFIDTPTTNSTLYGNHENIILKYDKNGVWVENQWGTTWGLNGWAELSWNFVNLYGYQVGQLTPIAPRVCNPAVSCPNPPPGCNYAGTTTCSCGSLICPSLIQTTTPTPKPTGPQISTITPTSGVIGTNVMITGSGFGLRNNPGDYGLVSFQVNGNTNSGLVVSWNDTQIVVTTPSLSFSGSAPAQVWIVMGNTTTGYSTKSNSISFQYISPSPTPTIVSSTKRVFVTSTIYNGNLGGLSGADAKCQTQANTANLGGTWKAWLSDDTTTAASRLSHNTGPYKLLNGTTIANNWTDLTDGIILTPIAINETNVKIIGNAWTWTGTIYQGLAISGMTCSNWTYNTASNTIQGISGSITSTDNSWTDYQGQFCSNAFHLYCFEQ